MQADADPDILDEAGYAALHYACMDASRKLIELLLSKGANPVLKTKKGEAPITLVDPKHHILRVSIGNAAGKRHAH